MKTIPSLLRVFQSKKMTALVFLGFASGLPYNLTRETLVAWMSVTGIDIGTIGWFNLANLPSTVKFLWSPLLDRYVPPFLGRRRGWMLITQLALIVAIAAMALHDPTQALQLLAVNAIAIAFLSATQDIAIDAYRTDVLEEREVGAGIAIWVLGYRVALLVTGSLALIWARYLSWQGIYLLMAALMGLGLLTSIFSPEPLRSDRSGNTPQSLKAAIELPFEDFFRRAGLRRGILILIFILLYKIGDYLAVTMTIPFLVQTGFSIETVGSIRGGMGLVATIVGGLVGGAVMSQIGINRSLWVFGGLQAVSNLTYFALAVVGQSFPLMVVAINVENFCAGLGTAAFLGFLTSLCNPRFSATQYALLSSLVAVSRDIVASPGGELAKATGWAGFFFITFCAALPGLLLLPIFAPWNAQSALLDSPQLEEDEPSDEV